MSAFSIRPAGVATSALHLNFAAQGFFGFLGATTSLFAIGRGWRGDQMARLAQEGVRR